MQFIQTVHHGTGNGAKIGYPTVNLAVGNFSKKYKQGVYSCEVTIDGKTYLGGLHFGPTIHSKELALEIFIIDFNRDLYDEEIAFTPREFIRDVIQFESFDELKKQIDQDVERIKKIHQPK